MSSLKAPARTRLSSRKVRCMSAWFVTPAIPPSMASATNAWFVPISTSAPRVRKRESMSSITWWPSRTPSPTAHGGSALASSTGDVGGGGGGDTTVEVDVCPQGDHGCTPTFCIIWWDMVVGLWDGAKGSSNRESLLRRNRLKASLTKWRLSSLHLGKLPPRKMLSWNESNDRATYRTLERLSQLSSAHLGSRWMWV